MFRTVAASALENRWFFVGAMLLITSNVWMVLGGDI
jgi:hypothetical protein